MRFEVPHLTRYPYERPVLLEPLLVRLRPRSDIFQRVVAFDLTADPQPEGTSEMVDAEGNAVSQLWSLALAPMLALRPPSGVHPLRTTRFPSLVRAPAGPRMP